MPGIEAVHPAWLLLLLVVPGLYAVWRRWPPPLGRGRGWVSLALRVLLVAFLVLALAGVRLTVTPHQRAVIAVADLSASDRQAVAAEADAVRALAASKGPDDLFGVVTFARDAAVEMPLTRTPVFDSFQTQPDPSYTDIASALQLAAGIAPAGYARQLVLIGDGRQNLGDAITAVDALRAQGVRVDVVAAGKTPAAEALVLGVESPSQLREGQAASVTVRLESTGRASGQLVISLDGSQLEARPVSLGAGVSSQLFALPPLAAGLHRVHVELDVAPDTFSQNNIGDAALRVAGRPVVLVLEGAAGRGANVAASLSAAGMAVDVRPLLQAPTDPAVLGRYDSVVLADTPADGFPEGGMQALSAAVKQLGMGLVSIGGESAYGPGGWAGTPLEDALPVRMDLPKRKENPHVAVVLVMESMEAAAADRVAIGAAEAVIDKLTPGDQVAVTDGGGGFVVPMTHVTDKAAIDRRLEAAQLGDSPTYLPFIQLADQALAAVDAPLKHIVVLGDGDAQDTGLQAELASLHSRSVTTSAVYIPDFGRFPGTQQQMQDIARWGGGRFYAGDNPSQVPELLLKESQLALRPWFEQFAFFPRVTAAGDLLDGVPLDAFPELGGYVATTAKSSAEVYLTSPKDDPVLAAWQYGLGRSVSWTPDAAGRWTAGFLGSQVSATLFARMVEWTLPNGGQNLAIDSSVAGDRLALTVTGRASDQGSLTVTAVTPDLVSESADLQPAGGGRWQGTIPLTAVGTYLIRATLRHGPTVAAQAQAAAVVPYSAEYLQLGPDLGFLKVLAGPGGALLSRPAAAWTLPLPGVPVASDLFWVLLLFVALLWPLDVAIRRLTLTPRQLASVAAALARRRRPSEIELAPPPELVRLTRRVSGYRSRPTAPLPPAESQPAAAASSLPGGSSETPTGEEQSAEALAARLLEARRRRTGRRL